MNLQTPRILWLGLLNATIVYAVVGFLVEPVDSVLDPRWLVTLVVLALGVATASFFVGARLRANAYRAAKLEVEEVPDPHAESMFRDSPPMIRQFAKPDRVMGRLLALSQTSFILELALSEAVAICGMIAAILGAEPLVWLPFVAVGALLIAVRFPTEQRFVREVERVYDARMQ